MNLEAWHPRFLFDELVALISDPSEKNGLEEVIHPKTAHEIAESINLLSRNVILNNEALLEEDLPFCQHIQEGRLRPHFLSALPLNKLEHLVINVLAYCEKNLAQKITEIFFLPMKEAFEKASKAPWNLQDSDFISKEHLKQALLARVDDVYKIARNLPYGNERVTQMARKILALQHNIGDEHFLFTHGLSDKHAELTYIIAQLDRALWRFSNATEFHFARAVPLHTPPSPLDEILKQTEHSTDNNMRNELLSMDVFLLNSCRFESALSFFSSNDNIQDNLTEILEQIGHSVISSFDMQDEEKKSQLIKDFSEMSHHAQFGLQHGARILAYSVPKSLIEDAETNFIYISRPLGKPINSNPNCEMNNSFFSTFFNYFKGCSTFFAKLEAQQKSIRMQDGEFYRGGGGDLDTVRILASHLRPEKGIRSFLLTNEPTSFSEEYANSVVKYGEKISSFVQGILEHCREALKTRDLPPCTQLLLRS